jgi:hypothetical protein
MGMKLYQRAPPFFSYNIAQYLLLQTFSLKGDIFITASKAQAATCGKSGDIFNCLKGRISSV